MRKFLFGLLCGCLCITVTAQSPFGGSKAPSWEFGPIVQGGMGVTDNRSGFKFLMAGMHVGKVLTPTLGTGKLRGSFEYAGDIYPYFQAFSPKYQKVRCTGSTAAYTCSQPYTVGGTFNGAQIVPIILRWNFTAGHRFVPWAQAAGGVLWTNHKFPAYPSEGAAVNYNNNGPAGNTSVFNFTPQGGVGFHYFLKPQRSIDFGANAVHVSSASLGDRNPGVNASIQFTVGYTWWK